MITGCGDPAHIKLRRWWSATRATAVPVGRPEHRITDLADRYDLAIPAEFRLYLSQTSPIAANTDDHFGDWWPLERLRTIPEAFNGPAPAFLPDGGRKFLVFLDHAIWAWAWAISCGHDASQGKVVVVGSNDRYVADSFSEFVDRYTTDWASVC